jgi:4-amino-4-deoxy-L-arabinose transferase-like glycosyltransferase
VLLATATHVFKLQDFFGPDALTYDATGNYLMQSWLGYPISSGDATNFQFYTDINAVGWGMPYLVGIIYTIVGRNPLAVQMFISVLGAATALLTYSCAFQIYKNERVARVSALFIAFFPSFILWSSQLLKDGIIVFLLALAMCAVLYLQEKFSYGYLAILVGAMFGIFAFRFYIFFAFVAAIAGSFIIGNQTSIPSIIRRVGAIVIISLALTYLGVLRNAGEKAEEFSNLERLNRSRQGQASAGSGYGEDIDVSTPAGALAALPIGFTYFMFAPFPWQITNVRQAITLPEMLVWWASVPFLLSGLWYTLRHRLRQAFSILLFSLILTVTYSIFQANVGTAYRQRAQMLVFYFIFVAVGAVLFLEKRENRSQPRIARRLP